MAEQKQSWMRGRWVKWALGGAGVAVLLFLTFAPSPMLVDTGAITQGAMEVTVTAEGRTRIHDIYAVSAPVSGRVLRITHDAGDQVIANETIVAIFEPVEPGFLDERTMAQAKARLSQADARVVRARAERQYAAKEYDRVSGMELGRTVTQKNVDLARSNRDTTEAAYQAALAERRAAQAALIAPKGSNRTSKKGEAGCCVTLTSPIDGQILRIVEKSERVMSAGTAIMEIGQPDLLEVVVDLLSQDAVKVRAGAKAYIENWGGDTPIIARVRLVEPSGFTKISALGVEEQRVNVILDLANAADGWQGLQDAYRVEPRIVVWRSPDAVQVPLSALFRHGNDRAVFVYDNGEARLQIVEIGQRNRDFGEVLAGLSTDDRVILHPSEDVQDGSTVTTR
ncbi:MAG: HlyD family efflux transporter periplasmic adaptor subunit [Alphaproteobacteria bacterium]|nr:MAG: HlyD family efflux transporter periplasmic adaptor subunit [Alphaproteobacteria bacterium]